ncbi:uncharacterized protein LOC121738398 isoform X2 [Aricia agestis]|uniref:uncharacterized protein LOC121738398 isoform X2 n=1 Tax=Aricia agestis TaxID=91739 RepID=UPI001C2081D4|nr:uncharacterized protein LOC121738398 isoform X2 [Aricia agestis]
MSFRNYYDSSSSYRNRDSGRSSTSIPTQRATVTAKYTSTPNYKTSSIPVLNDRSSRDEIPISTIANRYSNYNKKLEKSTPQFEKKDYTKIAVPAISSTRSRDVSPISTSSKYGLNRPTKHVSQNCKDKNVEPKQADIDKDIPNKTDKAQSYSGLSSYKIYPRNSSYTRSIPRTETKPDISVNRYAISNRLATSNYLKSPTPVKRPSLSPVNDTVDVNKSESEKSSNQSNSSKDRIEAKISPEKDICKENANNKSEVIPENEDEMEAITVVTRHTSPTPPGSSVYVRMRRADMAKTIEKTVTRKRIKPLMIDKEMQSDRLDDTTRSSRFGSTARTAVTNWTYYTPNTNSYTGYAGRYSTQYSHLREPSCSSYERSSRSRSKEPMPQENKSISSSSESEKERDKIYITNNRDCDEETINTYEEKKDDDTSEIIINVNLKLKKAKSPETSTELVSPEIIITNSHQLPPQPPKSETTCKVKKVKVRKSSTDSSSDSSSSKKVIKKKIKSASSTESDACSETGSKGKDSTKIPKKSKLSSSSSIPNSSPKLKSSKSRESNSPESSVTISTQSSISEDESVSKSKTVDNSRTSADETSIPTDVSGKHPSTFSPNKNENGTEEAKSFLIRALAPVTNLFKLRHQDSSDNNKWLEKSNSSESTGKDVTNITTESLSGKSRNSTSNIIASNDDNVVKLKGIRHIESGERAWWLESSSDKRTSQSSEHLSRQQDVKSDKNSSYVSPSENLESNKMQKQPVFVEDEKPWWLDSSANIPEGVERLTPPRKSSSDSDKSEKFNFFKVRHIESGEQKDWWLTSNDNSSNKQESSLSLSKSGSGAFPLRRIRHVESGERPWWLSSEKNIPEGIERIPSPTPPNESDSSESEEEQVYPQNIQIPPFPLHLPEDEPLGDRRSPEGLETPKEEEDYGGRSSPYENNLLYRNASNHLPYQKGAEKYISRYTDIDDILGTSGQIYSPFMDSILARRTGQVHLDDGECEEIDPTQVIIHDSTAQTPVIKKLRCRSEIIDCRDEDVLDDATLQVFKDGDYGPYLDLDSTLGEQDEELEGLQDSRKNALILRTQLSVRVHAIIERLLHSQGRELRKALFTLKQILQSDKDLVHEFVANKGLDCLMQVGNMADHNYLDYILRALGQILLYVDGMHGVMSHKRCVQWLYSLISSKFRHVVKTALKLLLVFVEYTDKNCLLLIDAINVVDGPNGKPWYNLMKILQDFDASDTELLIYATTLINRCLNNLPDKDMYYDQVDSLQEQGIDDIIQLYMSKQGTDLDLLRQLQIFEAVLLYEDGDETGTALKQLDESVIACVRRRNINLNTIGRRKSKKQQLKDKGLFEKYNGDVQHNGTSNDIHTNTNGSYTSSNGLVTNASRKYSLPNGTINGSVNHNCNGINGHQEEEKPYSSRITKSSVLPDVLLNGNQKYTAGLKQRIQNGTLGHTVNAGDTLAVIRQKQLDLTSETKDDRNILINREHSIKDIAQRLISPVSPTTEEKPLRVSDMAGIVLKAKEELAKSQSKEIVKSPSVEKSPKVHEIKVSENDLHWEELRKGCINREFHLCDLDFSDLKQDSDDDMVSPAVSAANGPPPPPPSMLLPPVGVPPPLPTSFPSLPRNNSNTHSLSSDVSSDMGSSTIKKNKKTVKLFWREIQENPAPPTVRSKVGGFIWDDLPDINIDTAMLEHLFESRSNDLVIKEKLMEPKRNLILDAKRSNAINIAMKKLPTPQTIKAAIMKMDATVIGREGIEKLLTMLPTQEEKIKIQEAQYANPDLPLGSAEQFLLTLASINELSSRLKLWVFKLDFDNLEKEIAEPLMDLKQGIELLKSNKTFKVILSTLRSVGSFLNGTQVKGFRLEYLSKVMEVKDTVHKHPLLYHVCEMIIEKFPDTTDFFSEVGPVIRASKVDFDVLTSNLQKLETDCKASWDHMKKVAKHDGSQIFKTKINEFLTDAAERIILLSLIKNRVMSRYTKFLLFFGVPASDIVKTKPSDFLKVIAEFALEYRTTRERVLQQLEKRANHRERNKTRGKMIIDVGNYSTKTGENTADTALKELLKADADTYILTDGRRKSSIRRTFINGDLSADDEIIESLVRATSKRRPITRDRRRNRLCDKKSLNRTLNGSESWPGRESSDGSNGEVQQR